jgi:hypothetical protein
VSTPLTRRTWLAAAMAAPALLAALGLTAIEVWRSVRPRSPLVAPPFAYSLAEAIETGNIQHAYQYLRAGQDPDQRIAVRHPELTRNRWVLALPIEWAAATGQTDAVRMLLGAGAHAPASAPCLADAHGHEDAARVLRTYGGEGAPAECDPRQLYPLNR